MGHVTKGSDVINNLKTCDVYLTLLKLQSNELETQLLFELHERRKFLHMLRFLSC